MLISNANSANDLDPWGLKRRKPLTGSQIAHTRTEQDVEVMKILSVTSEMFPLIKTGGLGDVAGSLPKAMASKGVEMVTLLPGYDAVFEKIENPRPVLWLNGLLGETATLLRANCGELELLVLDIPALYRREGGIYVDGDGQDHEDNWKRFAALSLAAAYVATTNELEWTPDLVHVHDWQTALTPVYMRGLFDSRIPVVLTIHNLAFQGQFPAHTLSQLDLPADLFHIDGLEYYGDISFLKGGLQFSDAITTVSPTYSREILTAGFGMGMDGVLKSRSRIISGIVNGIDPEIWNPETDCHLPRRYGVNSLDRRAQNRAALLQEFDLQPSDGCLFFALSRMTWQKGMDVLADAVDEIVANGDSLIVLGKGDRRIEQRFEDAAKRYPGRVAACIGYDEAIAHRLLGGADALIQPSRFEPCGLTQLYALRYGCLPIVSRTGGLSETIIDANDAALAKNVATGIQFHPVNKENILLALLHAREIFRKPKLWRDLQQQGMKTDFSWNRSADQYVELYCSLFEERSEKTGPGHTASNSQ